MLGNSIHISQINKNDCGIACINMILKYHGYTTNYSEIRNSIELSNRGLSIKNMVKYFKRKDINIRIFQTKNNKLETFNTLRINNGNPVIALLADKDNFHYIVIYKMKKGIITYSDPCSNRIKKEKNIDIYNKT